MLTDTQAANKFLTSLGIEGEEQDTVDLEYLQEVHHEAWKEIAYKIG